MHLRVKIIGIFAVIAVLAFSLVGCGKSDLTPSDVAGYWIIQNPDGKEENNFEKFIETGSVGAYVFNEEGLFTFLITDKNLGPIVRLGSYEINGDKVLVNLPEYKDTNSKGDVVTGDAIENAEIIINGDNLTTNDISYDGSETRAKRISKEEYQDYADQAVSHW